MSYDYIKKDEFQSEQQMKDALEFTIERVGRVSSILGSKKLILPFAGVSLPLLTNAEFTYIQRYSLDDPYFDSLPFTMKQKVFVAEKMKFWIDKFKDWMSNNNYTEQEFNSKNPKMKYDILLKFLFSEKLDTGILDLSAQV